MQAEKMIIIFWVELGPKRRSSATINIGNQVGKAY